MRKSHSLPGRLIAVEGMDGSGKSTQIDLLHKWLKSKGLKVFFSEWNSSELVKGATKKGKKRQLLTPTTFSLIHATDFADRYERQILPMLEAGYIVLCDRYVYTSFARDGVRDCDPEWLRELYSFAVEPDIAFYFQLPADVALNRILAGRPNLKWFEAGMDLRLSNDIVKSFKKFSKRVMDLYEDMVDEFQFEIIDGTDEVHDKQKLMRKIVCDKLELSKFDRRERQR